MNKEASVVRRVLFVTVLLLVLVTVSAIEFEVSVFPESRKVKLNESASFEIEIKDNSPFEELYEVFSNDVTWDVHSDAPLRVSPGKSGKANLVITPFNLIPGVYNLPINFKRSGSNDIQKVVVAIELVSPYPEDQQYLPAVRGVATMPQTIDPRQAVTFKLSLENQNRRILDKVDVKVRSKVINKDYTTRLGPLEKKTLTFIAEVDPKTPPQKDILQVSIIVPEKDKAYTFDLFPIQYEVIDYGLVVPHVETESAFLKWTDNITLTNEGNKPLTNGYHVPAWFAKRWFISTAPQARVEDGDLVWDVPLEAGASAQLVVIYNYRPLFWVLLAVIAGVVVYFIFRSPIAVMKRAIVVRTHEEGITELKVIVELVNRSGKMAKHIKVMDLVPHLADVVQEFKDTVLAPTKIVPHEQRGTLVRWDIDLMEPKEHRILMYRVRTKLSVLGGMTLPVTAVHFTVENHPYETVSNRPEIRHGR